jgi:hypothetical protein
MSYCPKILLKNDGCGRLGTRIVKMSGSSGVGVGVDDEDVVPELPEDEFSLPLEPDPPGVGVGVGVGVGAVPLQPVVSISHATSHASVPAAKP